MTSFVQISRDAHGLPSDTFTPEPKHSIPTSSDVNEVFEGVLHALAVKATGAEPVFAQTMFNRSARADVPLRIDKQEVDGLHVVHLLQDDVVCTQSIIGTSDLPEPDAGEVLPTEVVPFREVPEQWGWDTEGTLFEHMQGAFRKHHALMWFEGHEMDTAAVATLCGFMSIQLIRSAGQYGHTKTMTSHFTTRQPFEKSFIKHQIEGAGRGVLFTRLDQYNERGFPVCFTRMTTKLTGTTLL